MLVYGQDKLVADWVADKIEDVVSFDKYVSIGIATENKLICGWVYHNYIPHHESIEFSVASISPMWAKRENILALLQYPFCQLKVNRLYMVTRLTNIKAQKAAVHIGFKREAICHSFFGKDKHGAVYRMLHSDFERIYGDIDGKRQQQPTAISSSDNC